MAEKKTISAREVVADIRVGLTDDQLMTKHGLSAEGLNSLKNKLLSAGLLTQAELNGDVKSQPTQVATQVVDKKALARNISESVKSGLPDDEVVKRFGIPAGKLPGVFSSLIKAGYLTQEDLDRRPGRFEQTVDLGIDSAVPEQTGGALSQERASDVLAEFAARFKISREDMERLKSASIKDLKAILEKYDIPQEEVAKLLKAYSGQAGAVASEAKQQLLGSLRELVSAAQSEGDEEDKKAAFKKVPLKPLMMAAAALMFGWFWADVFTKGWIFFLLLFIVFTAAAFVGGFFLAEKSKFSTRLAAKHFGIVAAVFLVLNIVTMGGDGRSIGVSGRTGHPDSFSKQETTTRVSHTPSDLPQIDYNSMIGQGVSPRYIGKRVAIPNWTVSEVEKDHRGYYLKGGWDWNTGIPMRKAYVDPAKLPDVRNGEEVRVEGTYEGKVRDTYIFADCAVSK